MPSFHPRPFPPPSLSGVPIEYVVEQLHDFADQYWDKPDTADCTIIVPFPHGQPCLPPLSSVSVLEPSYSIGPSFDQVNLAGRRATAPPLNAVPRIKMQLHIDYLSAHSSYLRGLFSGALPIDLMYSSAPPTSNSAIPPERLPRLMPSSPDHPILFLPVPDPSSFYLLVHWMYFGDLSFIQECLHKGAVQWEGIARNAEYLGLNADLKIFLGNWYRAWLDPDRVDGVSEGNDSDTIFSDSDDDDNCSTASECDDMSDVEDDDGIGKVGRTNFTSQPLSTPLVPSPFEA